RLDHGQPGHAHPHRGVRRHGRDHAGGRGRGSRAGSPAVVRSPGTERWTGRPSGRPASRPRSLQRMAPRPAEVIRFIGRSAKRVAVSVVGGALVVGGLVMLVLPGPGMLVVVLGFAVLATEYV